MWLIWSVVFCVILGYEVTLPLSVEMGTEWLLFIESTLHNGLCLLRFCMHGLVCKRKLNTQYSLWLYLFKWKLRSKNIVYICTSLLHTIFSSVAMCTRTCYHECGFFVVKNGIVVSLTCISLLLANVIIYFVYPEYYHYISLYCNVTSTCVESWSYTGPRIVSCWLGHHCRTTWQNCGHCWTFLYPKSLTTLAGEWWPHTCTLLCILIWYHVDTWWFGNFA